MFTNQIDSTKKFVKDHQLALVTPIVAAVSFAVARNIQISGVEQTSRGLVAVIQQDAEAFRNFLVDIDKIDAFNDFLEARS